MAFNKKLAPKLAVILFVLAVTILATMLMMQNYISASIRQQYYVATYFRMDSFAAEFTSKSQECLDKTSNVDVDDLGQLPDDFYAFGVLNGTTVTLTKDGQNKDYQISSQIADNLKTKSANYYSLLEVLSNAATPDDANKTDAKRLLIFSVPQGQDDTKLGFFVANDFAVLNEEFGFVGYGVLFDSNKIVACNEEQNIGKRFQEFYGELPTDTTTVVNLDFNGLDTFRFTKEYPNALNEDISFTVFGIVDASIPSEFSNKLLTNQIVAVVIVLLICLMLTIIATIVSVKEYRTVTGADNRDYLLIVTDQDFNITKANKAFKKDYPNTQRLDLVYVNPTKMTGNLFCFKVHDKQGDTQYLTMLITRCLKGFRFIGVQNTSLIKEIGEGFKKIRYDDSTLLPNEKALVEDLSRLKGDFVFGIIKLLNIESFKVMFGHEFEKTLLHVYGRRFSDMFKRIGGAYYSANDSCFVVLVSSTLHPDFVKEIPHFMQELNKPIANGHDLVRVESKAGFVVCDKMMTDTSFENIMYYSEAALEKAMQNKDVLHYVYHESQRKYYQSFLTHDIDIKKLIDNNDIMVYYQPQYNIAQNRIVGVEALMRVRPSESMTLNTYQIVGIAEKTGCMILLSDYIYEQSLQTAKLLEEYNMTVSLNVSPIQLMQAGFAEAVLEKFNKYHLKHNSVCMEITESFLMSNFDETIKKLDILKNRGINIHLDDFGIAYSSMLYLKKLPISTIKIDKEFVNDMNNNIYSRTIVKSIIGICKNLELMSIAEGVETKEQRDDLVSLGIDSIQGYYISKAVSKEAIIAIAKAQHDKEKSV